MAHKTTISIHDAAYRSFNVMVSDISRFIRRDEIDPLKSKIKSLQAQIKILEKSVFHGDDIVGKWRNECLMRFALNSVYEIEIKRLCKLLAKSDKDYFDLLNNMDLEARRFFNSQEFINSSIELEKALFGDAKINGS